MCDWPKHFLQSKSYHVTQLKLEYNKFYFFQEGMVTNPAFWLVLSMVDFPISAHSCVHLCHVCVEKVKNYKFKVVCEKKEKKQKSYLLAFVSLYHEKQWPQTWKCCPWLAASGSIFKTLVTVFHDTDQQQPANNLLFFLFQTHSLHVVMSFSV